MCFIRMRLIFVAEQQHILVCRFAHIKHMHKLRYYRLLARDVAFAATHCCSNDKLERLRSNLGGGVVQFCLKGVQRKNYIYFLFILFNFYKEELLGRESSVFLDAPHVRVILTPTSQGFRSCATRKSFRSAVERVS